MVEVGAASRDWPRFLQPNLSLSLWKVGPNNFGPVFPTHLCGYRYIIDISLDSMTEQRLTLEVNHDDKNAATSFSIFQKLKRRNGNNKNPDIQKVGRTIQRSHYTMFVRLLFLFCFSLVSGTTTRFAFPKRIATGTDMFLQSRKCVVGYVRIR